MATTTATAALSMKLLIDSKAQRVLFAEASNEVVDFLFSLLALPVATAVKLVGKDAMVGCIGNLYASVDKLDSAYVQAGAAKDALLCPTVLSPAATTNSSLLRLPEPASSWVQPKKLYRCANSNTRSDGPMLEQRAALIQQLMLKRTSSDIAGTPRPMGAPQQQLQQQQQLHHYKQQLLQQQQQLQQQLHHYSFSSSCRDYVTDEHGKLCPLCHCSMTTAAQYLPSSSTSARSGGGGGSDQVAAAQSAAKGFVQGDVTYMVLDDLTVTPMSPISSITLLNTFAVRDIGDLHEKTVQLGYNEGLAILKASLQSNTVLTDVFLHGQAASSASTGGRA